MTLPTGTITMAQVNTELSNPSTSTISLNDTDVRSLASIPSGTISMDDLRGTSAYTGITATGGSTYTIPSYPGSDSPTGNFKVHVFTGADTFVVSDAPASAPSVTYWITGGGGGGGMPSSYQLFPGPEILGFTGGGGGGGLRTGTAPVNAQSYPITIGAGGTVTRNPQPPTTFYTVRVQGTPGGISSALSVSVHGGGTPNPGPATPTDQVTSGGAEAAVRFAPDTTAPSYVTLNASAIFQPFGGRGGHARQYLPTPANTYFGAAPSLKIVYFTQSGGGGGASSPGRRDGLAIEATISELNDPAFPNSAPIPTYQPAFPIFDTPNYFNPLPFYNYAQGQGAEGGDVNNIPAPTIAPAIPAPQRPAWITAVTNGSNTKVGGGGGGSGFYNRRGVDFLDPNVNTGIPEPQAQQTAESLIHPLITPNLPTIGIGKNGGGDGRAYFSPSQMTPPAPADPTIDRDATAGLANTGGGGGAMNWDLVALGSSPTSDYPTVSVPWPSDPTSGNGGSGIVIIGYPTI